MNPFVRQLKRYWRQIAAVSALLIVSVIGLSVALAKSVTVVLTTTEENPVTVTEWEKGYSETWSASVVGLENIDYDKISWTSSDPQVVFLNIDPTSQNQLCQMTALSAGKSTVTVQYSDDEGNVGQTSIDIVVKLEILTTFTDGYVFLDDAGTVTVTTNYASDIRPLTWSSSNPEVATVSGTSSSQAIVTAGTGDDYHGGYTVITATTPDNDQSVSFTVITRAQFTDPNKIITIGPNDIVDIYTGETNVSSASQLMFVSENDDYLLSDGTGNIKGLNAGTKRVYIYPDIDYSNSPIYATASPSDLAAKYGDSRVIKVSFGIYNGDLTGAVGDTVTLRVNTTDEDAKGVNWSSNDTNVATVDTNGKVTMRASGTAVITATLDNVKLFENESSNHTDSITITVVDSFAISETTHMMNVGDTFDLRALVTDETATVSWMSSDESIVSFEESADDKCVVTITGNKKGVATITAVQEVNGVQKYAYCEINVSEPVQEISLYPTKLEITKGDLYPLVLTFTPNKADNQTVKWVSSNENVVTVSETGVVTGVSGGDAVVSVITEDGIKVASCDIHVRVPVTGIKLSMDNVVTNLSTKNFQLSYTILPEGEGVDQSVVWSSSDESVLTVDQNGFVTFKNPGNAAVICQSNDSGVDGVNPIASCNFQIFEPVTAIRVDYTNITLKKGDTFKLTATLEPSNATDKSVTWVSSNTSVVSVDENGMLTAVGSGSAAVLVQSNDSGVTAMCNVTVYQPVESVTMNYPEMSVRKGTTFWLYATVSPDNAANKSITWRSSDTNIATVDDSGMVTAIAPGECTITATSQDTGMFASCSLTVTEPVTGISLNYSENNIYAGEKFALIPTVTPLDADNKSVTYVSSDPTIATVDENGIVTGVKGGSVIILVTTVERGLVASCKVTVYEFVSSVTINGKDKPYINVGSTKSLTATVTPDSATNRGVVWSSSNSSILTVNQKGIVTAVGIGSATITATAADGSGVFDSVVLTVINPVTEILVSPSYVTVIEGQSATVTATVKPDNATIKDIDWTSSNESVATVDYNGEITGVTAGICYVYATSTDGNEIVGKVKVTVKKAVPATSVIINSSEVNLLPGQNRILTYRLKPSTSTDTVEWITSDPSVITVDNNTGTIYAKGQGNAVVYAVTSSGIESEVLVNVLALNSSSITLEQYDNYQLDVFGATGTIVWYTNNNRVATVDSSGRVIARSPGTTTITAKVNGKLLYCKVTVKKIEK